MPIRRVKQYSDRGKIKDLVGNNDPYEQQAKPLAFELRMKQLFEYAQLHKDRGLQSALGFITTDYISDKNALPLSVYRIRKIVDDIKSRSAGLIDQLSTQFAGCMTDELSPETITYLATRRAMVKTAGVRKPPVFWRVRKS